MFSCDSGGCFTSLGLGLALFEPCLISLVLFDFNFISLILPWSLGLGGGGLEGGRGFGLVADGLDFDLDSESLCRSVVFLLVSTSEDSPDFDAIPVTGTDNE